MLFSSLGKNLVLITMRKSMISKMDFLALLPATLDASRQSGGQGDGVGALRLLVSETTHGGLMALMYRYCKINGVKLIFCWSQFLLSLTLESQLLQIQSI